MRTLLYATTALTAAGLIVGAAGDARAQSEDEQKIKIEIHGYFQQWGVAANQDIDGAAGIDFDASPFDQKHNSELCFVGATQLSSGIEVGIQVQMEANTSEDQIDESFMYVEGDWGLLQIGDTDNAAYKMAVVAPNGGVTVNDGDLVGISAFALPDFFAGTSTTIDTTPLVLTDDDSGKFNYFTPRYAGFQLGVSYIPQFESGGDNNNSIVRTQTDAGTTGPVQDGVAVGLNYEGEFAGIGVSASGGYLYGDPSGESGSADVNGFNGGVLFEISGIEFGGSFTQAYGDVEDNRSLRGHAYDVGIAYSFGPYKVGVTYIRGVSEGDIDDSSDQRLDQVVVSGTYTLGPGVDLVGGLFYYDADGEPEVAAANAAAGDGGIQGNDGYGAAAGFKLTF
jgi:hypothetical protein